MMVAYYADIKWFRPESIPLFRAVCLVHLTTEAILVTPCKSIFLITDIRCDPSFVTAERDPVLRTNGCDHIRTGDLGSPVVMVACDHSKDLVGEQTQVVIE